MHCAAPVRAVSREQEVLECVSQDLRSVSAVAGVGFYEVLRRYKLSICKGLSTVEKGFISITSRIFIVCRQDLRKLLVKCLINFIRCD